MKGAILITTAIVAIALGACRREEAAPEKQDRRQDGPHEYGKPFVPDGGGGGKFARHEGCEDYAAWCPGFSDPLGADSAHFLHTRGRRFRNETRPLARQL